jgi:hypothetical protein
MDDDRRRTALAAFALAATIVIILAMFQTLKNFDTRDAKKMDAVPGTTGLAKPRPPLDRTPGEPARQ